MDTSTKRFFIFVGGGIGDVLMTTPMFRAIKQEFQNAHIAVSVMGEPQKIILKNNKNIDEIINLGSKEYKGTKGTLKLVAYLRRGRFEYTLLNHIAERRNFFLSAFLAGIKNRIGYDHSSVAREKTYKYFVRLLTQALPYTIGGKLRTQLNLDILKTVGIDNSNLSYDLRLINKLPAQQDKGLKKILVGVHAGCDGRGELKRWDLENFIGLGKLIQNKLGYEVRFYVGPSETFMVPLLKNEFFIIEGQPLETVIEDISNCDYFISNDSGLAHVAAAFKIPTVVIFGPTIKNEYILPTKFIAVENNKIKCRPCFHLRKPCPINKLCMTSITAKYAFDQFKQFVEEKSD